MKLSGAQGCQNTKFITSESFYQSYMSSLITVYHLSNFATKLYNQIRVKLQWKGILLRGSQKAKELKVKKKNAATMLS